MMEVRDPGGEDTFWKEILEMNIQKCTLPHFLDSFKRARLIQTAVDLIHAVDTSAGEVTTTSKFQTSSLPDIHVIRYRRGDQSHIKR